MSGAMDHVALSRARLPGEGVTDQAIRLMKERDAARRGWDDTCVLWKRAECLAHEIFDAALEIEQDRDELAGEVALLWACLRQAEDECVTLRAKAGVEFDAFVDERFAFVGMVAERNRLQRERDEAVAALNRANDVNTRLEAQLEQERQATAEARKVACGMTYYMDPHSQSHWRNRGIGWLKFPAK